MKTQIESGKNVKELANSLKGEGENLFYNLTNLIFKNLKFLPIDEKEKGIRWKRTAEQILEDKYVYQGKACTDICIIAIAILKEKGIETKIVKLCSKKRKVLHNMIKTNGKYYDVTTKVFYDEKGLKMNDWKILAIGRDSWDIGLRSIEDEKKDLKLIK